LPDLTSQQLAGVSLISCNDSYILRVAIYVKLPNKISTMINRKSELAKVVHSALAECTPIISNDPEFFPEYTDHGPRHNTEVLNVALGILSEEALDVLTEEDFAALTLAVLLHDCGMHLTGGAFVHLVSPENNQLSRLDRQSWSEIWQEFLLEAKRFDGRKLTSLFGSTDPVSEPPADPDNYTKKDRLLIGEFLRQHHPRLAHDISVFGFPDVHGERIKVLPAGTGDLAEIAGLIARSHGMSLRKACDLFREHFDDRDYQGVHPTIIMAALRISDHLQIQPERAPESALKLRKLNSPYSMGEWRVHQSVRTIRADHDPDAIFVDAMPETVETFLKFREWAQSFQSELDATWATLGEVYGRYEKEGFTKFQLKLRRLRTSIDDEKGFSKRVSYIPQRIAFEASSADLLSLLVAPLYGDKPEVGLRELIQNSLDAVIERQHIEGGTSTTDLNGHDVDVIVYPVIEDDKITQVVIEDRGMGMDADVIQNYFLRAGASFRSSPQWKKEFVGDDAQAEIARTGRFGIGALACFLLGSSIDVETRRLGQECGLKFNAQLGKGAIEVTTIQRDVGTKISVSIDIDKQEMVGYLFNPISDNRRYVTPSSWDWYCNEQPSLLRLDKTMQEIESKFVFRESDEWQSVEVEYYNSVFWKHSKVGGFRRRYQSDRSALYCNGILIYDSTNNGSKIIVTTKLGEDIKIEAPSLIVTDNDGHLPINLQRDGATNLDLRLKGAVNTSVSLDLIAQAMALAPEASPFTSEGNTQLYGRTLAAYMSRETAMRSDYGGARPAWVWEDGGWRIADLSIGIGKPNVLVVQGKLALNFLDDEAELLDDVSVVWQKAGSSAGSQREVKNYLARFCNGGLDNFGREIPIEDRSGQFRLPQNLTAYGSQVKDKLNQAVIPNYLKSKLKSEIRHDGPIWSLSWGSPIEHPILPKLFSEIPKGPNSKGFAFRFITGSCNVRVKADDVLVPMWRKYFGAKVLPTSFEERKTVFPQAFEELGPRIEYYRRQLD